MTLDIALVSRDARIRDEMARSFDGAPVEWRVSLHAYVPRDADVVVAGPDAEVPGAVSYEPAADLFDRISAASPTHTRSMLVVGGLPGSGRTSIAIHLAAVYALTSSVCLVDRDPARGAALRLGIKDPRIYRRGDDVLLAAVPVHGGFRLLSTDDEPDDAVRGAFDRLIVDEPLSQQVDVAVIQPTSPHAHRAASLFADARPRVVVTNRLGRGGETTRRDVERILSRRVALELPHTPALRDAEDDGILVPKWTRWWGGIRRLARALGS